LPAHQARYSWTNVFISTRSPSAGDTLSAMKVLTLAKAGISLDLLLPGDAVAGSRTIGRLQALRTRLGGTGDLLEPFPARPKHMQWSTYVRLRALDLELWRRCSLGLASDLERLRRRSASIAPKTGRA
jgi:hypothetical protein